MTRKQNIIKGGRLVAGIGSVVLQTLFQSNPEIAPTAQMLILAGVATFALGLDFASPDVKELWKELDKQHPGWKRELSTSHEFQQAFILTLEAIARTRNENKRRLIRAVFLDEYISADDRQKSTIERYYRVIQDISIEALEHLLFITRIIIPRKEELVRVEVDAMDKKNRGNDDAWWFKRGMDRMPESQVIDKWIYEEYNINSPSVKVDKPHDHTPEWEEWMHKHSEEEYMVRKHLTEIRSELISLGIMIQRQDYDGSYGLTDFGRRIMGYASSYYKEVPAS